MLKAAYRKAPALCALAIIALTLTGLSMMRLDAHGTSDNPETLAGLFMFLGSFILFLASLFIGLRLHSYDEEGKWEHTGALCPKPKRETFAYGVVLRVCSHPVKQPAED